MVELKRRGVKIPPEVIKDLRSAKVMISLYKVAPTEAIEAPPRIELYLASAKATLLILAERELGRAAAEWWTRRICELRAAEVEEKPSERFIPGFLRGEGWMRIRISEDLKVDDVERIAGELNVEFSHEPEGYVTLRGNPEKLRKLSKKLAELIRFRRQDL